MTFSIKIAGANFSNYVAEALPHAEFSNLFLLLGGDAAKSTRNYAGVQQTASVIGAPVYSVGSCTLSEANGFEGAMLDSGSPFTNMIISAVASSNVGYCGNWLQSGGAAKQANALSRNASNLSLAVDSNNRATVAMVGTGFRFMAGVHDGVTAKAYVGNNGGLSTASAAYVGGLANKAKFRAGATGYGAGTFEAAAALSFSAALSDQQVADVYGYLRRLLADRGVKVA